MALDLNSMLDLHGRSLTLANKRMEVLAENMANADTPNYKARDIDFKSALAAATDGGELRMAAPRGGSARAGHVSLSGMEAGANGVTPKYRVPDQPTLDGNTVDAQRENAAFAETAIRYQTSLTFLQSRIQGLRSALSGSR
jgi:flagellar basal-body rod protein FlgB